MALGTSSSAQGGSACAVPSLTSQCQTLQLAQAWRFPTVLQPPTAASSCFCQAAWPHGHCPGPPPTPAPALQGGRPPADSAGGQKEAPGPAGRCGSVGRSLRCGHPQSRAPQQLQPQEAARPPWPCWEHRAPHVGSRRVLSPSAVRAQEPHGTDGFEPSVPPGTHEPYQDRGSLAASSNLPRDTVLKLC